MQKHHLNRIAIPVMTLALALGCSSTDERLVELSKQSADRQAAQSQQMAQQGQQIASAAHDLVQWDAQARREMVEAQSTLQQGLQNERADLDQQHAALEHERQEIAATRNRDPIVAGAIVSAAVLLACVLPVLVCLFVIRLTSQRDPDDDIAQLLVQELVADEPLLLPISRQPALPNHSEPRPQSLDGESADR